MGFSNKFIIIAYTVYFVLNYNFTTNYLTENQFLLKQKYQDKNIDIFVMYNYI